MPPLRHFVENFYFLAIGHDVGVVEYIILVDVELAGRFVLNAVNFVLDVVA